MADYAHIYANEAAAYHALISAEDADGAVPNWFRALSIPPHADVLDVGAGTGRLAAMLATMHPTARITCTDGFAAMLDELRAQWDRTGTPPTTFVADYRALPLDDAQYDLVTAGWALGHLTGFYPDSWQAEADKALGELLRVARPGASIVILETLGTGTATAAPPKPALGELYARFEAAGFTRSVLRTDYRFASQEAAERLAGFFFGDRILGVLETLDSGVGLIEWTGVWHLISSPAENPRIP